MGQVAGLACGMPHERLGGAVRGVGVLPRSGGRPRSLASNVTAGSRTAERQDRIMNETLATATHPVQAELLPRRIGKVVTGVLLAWLVFVLVGGLEAMGRHFVVLGVLRLAMFAALLALILAVRALASRMGRL